MPLFMDRHDVPEMVTAENVAHIHQEDLKIQDQLQCKVLTYWFDEQRKNAFCLIEAPDAEAIRKLHAQAHGEVPNSIIEVNAGLVASFLGRIEDPEKTQDTALNIIDDSALRTIMVLTLKRSKPMPDNTDSFRTPIRDFNNTVRNLLEVHHGSLVKQTETFFLVSFKSADDAVHAALAIQSSFQNFILDSNKEQFVLKIGLSAGLPVTEKKLIFEDVIKLAERMCKIVQGEIIVSPEVAKLYKNGNSGALGEKDGIFCLTPVDEKFLTLLMNYTEATWSNENLQIDDFSKPTGCSKSQLYRKMVSLTGKSPNSFVMEYRLNEALDLLNSNAGNIAEIAFNTGFSSPSYFSKCFKKKFGNLPSDYLPVKAR